MNTEPTAKSSNPALGCSILLVAFVTLFGVIYSIVSGMLLAWIFAIPTAPAWVISLLITVILAVALVLAWPRRPTGPA